MASISPSNEDTSSNNDNNDEGTAPSLPGGETLSWFLLPPFLSAFSFLTYQDVKAVFHDLIDEASGHTWVAADGGKFMAEMVRPVLNGPVTLSISILFGTLVATTVSTLYSRQISLKKTVISAEERVRHINLLVDGLPEPYRAKAKKLLKYYVIKVRRDFADNAVTEETLLKQEMNALLLLLNRLSKEPDCPGGIVGEVYGALGQMVALRSEFRSSLETVFSPAHYANMVALAGTILFVFLLETDQDAMQYLLGFQLGICWALLIGTYSLLAVVIFDLATPFAGEFSILRGRTPGSGTSRELFERYLSDLKDDGTAAPAKSETNKAN